MKNSAALILMIMMTALSGAYAQTAAPTLKPLTDPQTNCELRYYYFPNLQAYFDTKTSDYIFKVDDEWTKAKEIPAGYRGYSLQNKICVLITDYDDDDPTQYTAIYKKKYPANFNGRSRPIAQK
ncbi:MAG: hypothetical protein EOO51_05820 [Flavobacterium sp.]|nr:MAG: hypothetical protein EOO51_05820 [Flavobacterium sp.]